MENASKALLIAGGILVSLITISIFTFAYFRMTSFAENSEKNPYEDELLAFNSGFEAYNKNVMYGIDIISVLNKAIDNNKRYGIEFYDAPNQPDSLDYYVNIKFTYNEGKLEGENTNRKVTYSLKDNYTIRDNTIKTKFIDPIFSNQDSIKNFKTIGFKCSKITYNNSPSNIFAKGRVNQLEFVELDG